MLPVNLCWFYHQETFAWLEVKRQIKPRNPLKSPLQSKYIQVYTFSIQKHRHQNMDNLTPPPPLTPLPNFFLG